VSRLAYSLDTFRRQLDHEHPDRAKVSDGWIADDRHVAEAAAQPGRPPWEVTQHIPNGSAVVCALDVTHDPAHDVDCQQLFDALCAAADPRLFYAIFNGRIRNSDGTVTDYHGADDHSRHLHVSTWPDRADLYDNPAPWALTKEQDVSDLSPETVERIAERVVAMLVDPRTGRGKWNLQAIYDKCRSVDARVDAIDDTVVATGKDAAAAVDLLHQLVDVVAALHQQNTPTAGAAYTDAEHAGGLLPTI
jgi:hypothetical protein